MIAIDTNVIVRLITQDDKLQYHKALRLIEKHEVLIADTVVLETVWVLTYAYQYNCKAVCSALRCLFGLANIHLSQPAMIADAINWYENGMDFADALHLSTTRSCHDFYTFDKKFIRKASELKLNAVMHPPASKNC